MLGGALGFRREGLTRAQAPGRCTGFSARKSRDSAGPAQGKARLLQTLHCLLFVDTMKPKPGAGFLFGGGRERPAGTGRRRARGPISSGRSPLGLSTSQPPDSSDSSAAPRPPRARPGDGELTPWAAWVRVQGPAEILEKATPPSGERSPVPPASGACSGLLTGG